MAVQIVIFLAFTSVTLVFNSVVIWFAYKAFANVTLKVTRKMNEFHTSEDAKRWMKALKDASERAITVTEATRDEIHAFEPVLAKAQSAYGYGLAKMDVRVESLCENIRTHVESAQTKIEEPCLRFGSVLLVMSDLLERFSFGQSDRNGNDASATPLR